MQANRAESLFNLGRWAEAADCVERVQRIAVSTKPLGNALMRRADLALLRGELDAATASLAEAHAAFGKYDPMAQHAFRSPGSRSASRPPRGASTRPATSWPAPSNRASRPAPSAMPGRCSPRPPPWRPTYEASRRPGPAAPPALDLIRTAAKRLPTGVPRVRGARPGRGRRTGPRRGPRPGRRLGSGRPRAETRSIAPTTWPWSATAGPRPSSPMAATARRIAALLRQTPRRSRAPGRPPPARTT